MKNYSTTKVKDNEKRIELHDTLGLTGAEISINELAAGKKVPLPTTTSKTRKSMRFCPAGARPLSMGRRYNWRKATGFAFPRRESGSFCSGR